MMSRVEYFNTECSISATATRSLIPSGLNATNLLDITTKSTPTGTGLDSAHRACALMYSKAIFKKHYLPSEQKIPSTSGLRSFLCHDVTVWRMQFR